MKPKKETVSESLFEKICQREGFAFSRVLESSERRPDYTLALKNTKLIVEVKELQPTKEEWSVIRCDPGIFDGSLTYHWGTPGEKIRKKIADANAQLKALSKTELPSLLVLHDPVQFWPELLDSDSVRAAMYGIETALISPEPAPGGGATVLKRRHGGRKKLTDNDNTSLSAIGILFLEEGHLRLDVFHNWYATVPLEPSYFSSGNIRHLRLEMCPTKALTDWVMR
ncbi:hypothetical protein SNE35_06410 [Paucibacter sp. R3-3]|uniref:NERD domain-containing protein n=1 Tax=Roseateles agri TaxID=3098619 RepID=A0ABU5DCY1_9BURK|nr:hypothetical protein [Paucibacter sp. R3-3]MDY0744128.1 hypothetical protein [Paucibacter sp. R3-3]